MSHVLLIATHENTTCDALALIKVLVDIAGLRTVT